jgi:hypothetical protein
LKMGGITVVEVQHEEALSQLRLLRPEPGAQSESATIRRKRLSERLLEIATELHIDFSEDVRNALMVGFDGAEDFESIANLIAVVSTLKGKPQAEPPDDPFVLAIEGWIFGQNPSDQAKPMKPRAAVNSTPGKAEDAQYTIERISFGFDKAAIHLDMAYAVGDGRGALNIFCGLNAVGKSFLLEQIHRELRQKSTFGLVKLHPQPAKKEKVLFIGQAWVDKDRFGLIELGRKKGNLNVSGEHGDYLRVALKVLLAQMQKHLQLENVDLSEANTRELVAKAFPKEAHIYRFSRTDPTITAIEQILRGTLYFQCVEQNNNLLNWRFQFLIAHDSGSIIPIQEWSDGQKACFYILTSVAYEKPDIVLIDEIENHLHPAMVSEVLAALKRYPAQILLTTHHPHLVFSRYADRVFYVDAEPARQHPSPPLKIEFKKQRDHLVRKITTLEDDFEKISAAYRLFADQDDQLLRQAGFVAGKVSLALFKALLQIFTHRPVTEKGGLLPDAQTQQLADRIRSFGKFESRDAVDILDLGSGMGRQVVELAKLSKWQLGTTVTWTCYEPIAAYRAELKTRLGANGIRIPESLKELNNNAFDVCVISNVLHELTPPEFASFIANANKYAKESGIIVTLEIFPLIHPEDYAVPYPETVLHSIFTKCGLSADYFTIPLRQPGITAYCVVARPKSDFDENATKQIVEASWLDLKANALSRYDAKQRPINLSDYQSLLATLTTIASIEAWLAGKWKAKGKF